MEMLDLSPMLNYPQYDMYIYDLKIMAGFIHSTEKLHPDLGWLRIFQYQMEAITLITLILLV